MGHQSNTLASPWFWIAAALGLAWNLFNGVQFLATVGETLRPIAAALDIASRAASAGPTEFYVKLLLVSLQVVSVFANLLAGALGCVFLLMRKASSVVMLAVSLIAYVVQFVVQAALGIFTNLSVAQIAILFSGVLIPAALLWFAMVFQRRGVLR